MREKSFSVLSGCLCIPYEISRETRIFFINSHSTTKRLKHSSNFKSVENIQSLNVVEFEFELRHIPKHDCVTAETHCMTGAKFPSLREIL